MKRNRFILELLYTFLFYYVCNVSTNNHFLSIVYLNVAIGPPVSKHQAISAHSPDFIFMILDQFHTTIVWI